MALYTSILTGGVSNHPTTSEEANFYSTDFVNSGVVGTFTATGSVAPMTGAFACNAQGTPDMTIAVTAGAAYLSATPAGQNSQKLRVRLSANQNVTISANSSGSTKYDWVYIKIDPTLANAPTIAGDTVATLVTSRSSSSTTDDGTPPTYGLNIAVVTVANGASSIANASIRDKRVQASTTSVDTSITTGWVANQLPAVSSVTHNGNRSYDITFASTVASILSPGMRLKGTKTVAGNGYMGGAFNGSSHYFTKTSPTGTLGTVTNNFTIEANVMPTSYAGTTILGRCDSVPNNGFQVLMQATGQIAVTIWNGGTVNIRTIQSYQSLPLNKKTHVAVSWNGTGPAVTIYFDGVAVSAYQSAAGGTNPTTAGTGGDFSIGRPGAYAGSYFPGYISNVAVFDAVLTAATIRQHATYKLTGSETNCIGAWSLDNTANDQSSAGNNLTATGGVGYTAISPHGQMGDAVHTDQFAALVMAVSGSTATVQLPEGCTIPTTGGVTSVSYSVQGNPFGWVSDNGRWELCTLINANLTVTLTSSATWYNFTQLSIPTGSWNAGYTVDFANAHAGASYLSSQITLSTTNNGDTNVEFRKGTGPSPNGSSTNAETTISCYRPISLTTLTSWYLNAKPTNNSQTGQLYATNGPSFINATPSNL